MSDSAGAAVASGSTSTLDKVEETERDDGCSTGTCGMGGGCEGCCGGGGGAGTGTGFSFS